jgi:heme-degrading monooxygenase HmoA
MIARIWRGATRAEDADAYADYLRRTGVKEYRETPGNEGVFMLRRIVDGRAEFMMITLWRDLDAVRSFAGDDVATAVFYPRDDDYLIERELTAEHWEIVDRSQSSS